LLGVLTAAVIAAGVKLWQDIDIQRLTRSSKLANPLTIPTALPPASAAAATRPYHAVLYYSHATAGHFPDSAYYPGLLDRWEGVIAATGASVSRISSAAQIGTVDADDVIVAPSAVCLSESEVAELRAHADRGGGLVVTWASGARDSTCNWLGWDAATALTGSGDIREINQRSGLYLTIPTGLPLSLGFDPGTRVELRYESQLAAESEGARVYWSDWALNGAPVTDAEWLNAAALTSVTNTGGRVAWFGFRLDQGARPQDERRIEALAANGVRWAASVPTAEILSWPGGARAALLVAQDVETEFINASALARLARRKSFPVTFFVVSQTALDYPELADSLVLAGEVGSQTSDHTVLSDLSFADQRTRLSRSWAEVRGWTGDSAFGLHPPEERFDANTLRAWRQAGGRYLVALNDARTAAPEVFETAAGNVVLLPRIIKDDYNVFVQESAMRSRRLTEAYLEGLVKVRSLGGLGVVSLRSQMGGVPGRVGVIGEVVDSVRAQGDWWVASGRTVAAWWLSRQTATLRFVEAANDQFTIEVTAPGDTGLRGAWVRLLLAGESSRWLPSIEGELVAYAETQHDIRVSLPDMAPGEQVTLAIRKEDSPR
jgi:peptidoglycan/xylan/chitin deacetylase (PgdA/CDA1 family)